MLTMLLTANPEMKAAAAARGLDCAPTPPAPAPAPPAPPDDERRLEIIRRRESRLAVLAALRELGCATFGNSPWPLSICVDVDLVALLDSVFPVEEVRPFVRWWVTREPYLEALARGEPRRDLDGIITSEA